ncbi:MAG: polyprenol monophosphomannose synthase [Ignavibacteriales bacterium]|nr:polyprenol monophosphomannose synthase [Ignavibacteriales bacterium]MBI3787973.1 polyprenol monophosphomannose synthase [Ignavibacteriales bacterium]
MKRPLVVIPTYNEVENLPELIPTILGFEEGFEVLVVDDNSPDGTARLVKEMMHTESRIHLIERKAKMGLGTAYVAGFRYALEKQFDYIFEMDADFSHDPAALHTLFKKAQECDLVIGSRYISGVNVVNWPMRRLILSYCANLYTRIITGMPVRDATSGFKCFRKEVLKHINLDAIHSNGYAFQIEMDFLAWRKGFRVCEIPIIFVDRRVGISKMSKNIVYEAAWVVWKLKFRSLFSKI